MPKKKTSPFTIVNYEAKNPSAAKQIAGHLEARGYKTLIIQPSGSNPYWSISGGKAKSTGIRKGKRRK